MSNPQKAKGCPFKAVVGDMLALPFANEVFDKVVSIFKKTMIPPGRRKLKGKAGCEVFGRFFGCPLGEAPRGDLPTLMPSGRLNANLIPTKRP